MPTKWSQWYVRVCSKGEVVTTAEGTHFIPRVCFSFFRQTDERKSLSLVTDANGSWQRRRELSHFSTFPQLSHHTRLFITCFTCYSMSRTTRQRNRCSYTQFFVYLGASPLSDMRYCCLVYDSPSTKLINKWAFWWMLTVMTVPDCCLFCSGTETNFWFSQWGHAQHNHELLHNKNNKMNTLTLEHQLWRKTKWMTILFYVFSR